MAIIVFGKACQLRHVRQVGPNSPRSTHGDGHDLADEVGLAHVAQLERSFRGQLVERRPGVVIHHKQQNVGTSSVMPFEWDLR